MIIETLTSIKDYILEYNQYLDKGYEDVSVTETGMVYAHKDNNEVIFPNDKLGSYFYMRISDKISAVYVSAYKGNDCENNFSINPAVSLVCCMRKADKYQLLNNIASTLIGYSADLKITDLYSESEAVIRNELSKVSKAVRDKALSNKDKSYTIIGINFTVLVPYNPIQVAKEDCLPNPCESC